MAYLHNNTCLLKILCFDKKNKKNNNIKVHIIDFLAFVAQRNAKPLHIVHNSQLFIGHTK